MAEKVIFDVRKYKRLNLTEPLPVSIKTSNIKLRSDKEIKGVIGNVSAGGAMLISPVFIPRKATVEIEIPDIDSLPAPLSTNSRVVHHEKPNSPPSIPLPLKATSKVVHTQARITSSKRDKNEHFYYIGIEFLDVSDEICSAVNKWVEKVHLENSGSQNSGVRSQEPGVRMKEESKFSMPLARTCRGRIHPTRSNGRHKCRPYYRSAD